MMKKKINEKVKEAIIVANTRINKEIKPFIDNYRGPFSDVLQDNFHISSSKGIPLCQDTGMVEFFCFLGVDFPLNRPLQDVLDEVVSQVYTKSPYRYSTVDDPLFERKNRMDNTPAIVHIHLIEGSNLEIKFLIKGGGSENLSRLYMMAPSSSKEDVVEKIVNHIKEAGARACPPLKVGIGLGGTSEKAMMLSKLALTSSISKQHDEPRYAALEEEIKSRINKLNIGFQGLNEGISCYSVHILTHPTHIATLPLAISADCYLCRTGSVCFEC
ncbi:MAG: fumarate hydratase [Thermotogota bacterium]|nr:fumarate hydratase [Thermotogota bacterium]